jgi:prepilin-type N-terminal cleavage/methylation domain-containing protein
MKNRKGFSLVELLGVIILLGIISVIIVPNVVDTIANSSKKAFTRSVQGVIESAQNYLATSQDEGLQGDGYDINYMITNKMLESKNLELNKFTSGNIKAKNVNGTIMVVNLTDGNYCANGTKNNLTITEGSCN